MYVCKEQERGRRYFSRSLQLALKTFKIHFPKSEWEILENMVWIGDWDTYTHMYIYIAEVSLPWMLSIAATAYLPFPLLCDQSEKLCLGKEGASEISGLRSEGLVGWYVRLLSVGEKWKRKFCIFWSGRISQKEGASVPFFGKNRWKIFSKHKSKKDDREKSAFHATSSDSLLFILPPLSFMNITMFVFLIFSSRSHRFSTLP